MLGFLWTSHFPREEPFPGCPQPQLQAPAPKGRESLSTQGATWVCALREATTPPSWVRPSICLDLGTPHLLNGPPVHSKNSGLNASGLGFKRLGSLEVRHAAGGSGQKGGSGEGRGDSPVGGGG